ncbi:tetratricopeptide repeat protein [bacterium]|nr:tetratricopeptide repeat protein [bacterium]|tara:strand:+ start:2178 stop:2822 length:645 start_codon:yes stop_codon:yes gene_type:complete
MEQEIEIINTNTRNEKIKKFFVNYKKHLFGSLIITILGIFSFFFYQEYKLGKKEELADYYNLTVIKYNSGQKKNIETALIDIINAKDKTYSPLALYFLIDEGLINSNEEINKYFDILINDVDFEKEIRHLIIFKKGLFNSDFAKENELLGILNPVIKSESVWRPHAIFLMAEYYLAKNQKQKSKEFFKKLVDLENINTKIKIEAEKRLRIDFSE